MKPYGIAIIVMLLSLGTARGQQAQPRATQSTAVTQTPATSSRRSYDPMAREGTTSAQPKGIVETTLAGINPQNKDYGSVVAAWRKEVFETTVNRVYLWSIFILCLVLGASLLGNGWLFRERQRRVAISANMVVQLYNAYIGSRAKALEVIGKHNTLVERYNQLSDEMSTVRSRKNSQKEEAGAAQIDYDRAEEDKEMRPGPPVMEVAAVDEAIGEDDEVRTKPENLRRQLQEYESKLQRKDAQLQAKENTITNLRSRLARAHDSLEGQRLQKSETK